MRSSTARWLLALLFLPLAVRPAFSGDDPASSLAARFDQALAPYVAANDFAGVIGVGRDGEPPVVRAYGLASLELGVPHRPDNVFIIGSVSKQFTAAAILLLEEDGVLATTDKVGRHLPGFRHGDRITIEQLLTHTSGIADVYTLTAFGATEGRSGSFEQVLDELGRRELTHEPGTAYAYSNGGYSLLAALIERVSGDSYADFLARRIFAPLGITATAADASGPAVPRRVAGYDPWGPGGLTPAPTIAPAFSTGSGSLWSSAGDLIQWSEALHGGRLLAPASYDKLIRDYGHGYGYGISVFRRFGRRVAGHDGRISGYASDLARYLDDRVTVVVLSNVQSVARDEIRRLVAAIPLGEKLEPPVPRAYDDSPATGLSELIGVYSFGPTLEVTISATGGRLLARANEGSTSELVPLADGGWFSRVLYTTVRFGRDGAGRVDRLLWGPGEGAPAGERVD